MKTIIDRVPRENLRAELNEKTFVRKTNYGGREIYITNVHESPAVIREIGRLREIAFRLGGGGTGEELDLDEYDTAAIPFQQLVVWSPEDEEIVGGYRFQFGSKIIQDAHGHWNSPTAHLFAYNSPFVEKYLPKAIELGRSFIQPTLQSGSAARGGVYSLDNLWDGLGAIAALHPQVEYFFGKITMYPSFNPKARDLILYFMQKYCPDGENLLSPLVPVQLTSSVEELAAVFDGGEYKADYKILSRLVRDYGENIPPLFNAYMNLSPTMKTFGTAVNEPFGMVEETGILLTLADIYPHKKERHLDF